MLRDLRVTLRLLVKAPGYTVAAIVTLALAIGATSAIFGAVYAVLLRPLPIRESDRLMICWETDPPHNLPIVEMTYRAFENVSLYAQSFSHVAAMGSTLWPVTLKNRGVAQRLSSAGVSARFFETIDVSPLLGRAFRPDDDLPNAPRIVVLSYTTWNTRFGGDAAIVGERITVDDEQYTVVGVMPRDLDFPRGVDLWTPVVPILAGSADKWHTDALRNVGVLYTIGRLRPHVTPRQGQDDLDRLASQLERAGSLQTGVRMVSTSFVEYTVGPVRQALWALLGAVVVLLLIGCANVSGLMLTRVSFRRREHAIRLALGATSLDVGRLWIIETSALSLAGGLLGFIASHWIIEAVVALAPVDVPRLSEAAINLPVALFAWAASMATACLCGVGPLRQAAASNLALDLNEAGRGIGSRRSQRARSVLVVLQIALSIVLLVAAGLVVRSFLNLRRLDLGFQPSGVLALDVRPDNPKLSENAWIDAFLDRLAQIPGVDAVGAVSLRPLALGPIGQETWVILEGQALTSEAARQNPTLNYEVATPGYFAAMNVSLKRGRLFTKADNARAPRAALVGESTARRLWPAQDAIGKRILMPTSDPGGPEAAWRTVVGIVSDVRYRGLDDVRLDVYDAALRAATGATTIIVKTSQHPAKIASVVQTEARRIDPQVVIDGMTTMDAAVARAVAPWRFSAWTFAVFAMFAFTLAIVGLVSLVALDVAHRQRELALRLAIGARRVDVVRCILGPAARRVLVGAALGVGAAVAGSRALNPLLFGIASVDGITYLSVLALVIGAVTVASYLPARKAAGVDPATLLTPH
jgi:putative ABC transport system permease protein